MSAEGVTFVRQCGWVHVSDVHFDLSEGADDAKRSLIIERLVRDLADLATRYRIDVVVVTGDVASRGGGNGGKEFSRGALFVEKLRAIVGADKTRVLYVPGNHDVERQTHRRVVKTIVEAIQHGDARVDDYLADDEASELLAGRMQPAVDFWSDYGPEETERTAHGWWRCRVRTGDGLDVEFVGLNTTLASYQRDEQGKLDIGLKQLELLPDHRPPHPVVVLGHHPFSWIQHERATRARVSDVADAYLCGHTHDPEATSGGPVSGRPLLVIGAGAIHASDDEEEPIYAYSVGVLGERDDRSLCFTWAPRRWSEKNQDFRADTDVLPRDAHECTTIELRKIADEQSRGFPRDPDQKAGGGPSAQEGTLSPQDAHEYCVRQLGRRRVVAPHDYTYRDLLGSSFFVEPTFGHAARESAPPVYGTSGLAGLMRGDESILLLGERGSGKSVAAYAALRAMGAAEPYGLLIDLGPYCDVVAVGATLGDPLRHVVGLASDAIIEGAQRRNVRLVVDGVDEALAGGLDPRRVAKALEQLCSRYPALVISRGADYERQLARYLEPDLFGRRHTIRPWSADREFATLVGNLSVARMGDNHRLWASGEVTPARELLVRPLHAQMLAGLPAASAMRAKTATKLYSEFLAMLALQRAGDDAPPETLLRWWGRAASEIYFESLMRGASLTEDTVVATLADEGLTAEQARTALSPVVEFAGAAGHGLAAPLHFSVYEFLVALAVADALDSAVEHGDARWKSYGRRELNREMRHHLVELLALVDAGELSEWIAREFTSLAGERSEDRHVLFQLNLLIYLAGRLREVPPELLRRVADDQHADPFLVNGAMWSLAARNDWDYVSTYVARLEAKPQLRRINRGYHCWYYGDIPSDATPPFRDDDDDPFPWSNARIRILEKLRDDLAQPTVPARTLLDVYTFLDFIASRRERLTSEESLVVGEAVGTLRVHGPARAVSTVRENLRNVLRRA